MAFGRQQAAETRDNARDSAAALARAAPGVTASDVLAIWDEAAAQDPSDFWTHIERARLAQTLGDLPSARRAAEAATSTARADWERRAAQAELGDVALLQGDLTAAQRAYDAYLAIYRRLVAANPGHGGLQRNLSVSLEKVGNVAVRRGDLARAAAVYGESLELARALAAADPTDDVPLDGVARR